MSAIDRFARDAAITATAPRADRPLDEPIPECDPAAGPVRRGGCCPLGGRLAATTLSQYRLEAERLFWYARQNGVPISARTLDEFSGYIGFLQALTPWVVRKPGVRRGSSGWRAFLGPLRRPDTKIVTALFDWLRDIGYLQLNPASGLPTPAEKQARVLSLNDTALLCEAIAAPGRGIRPLGAPSECARPFHSGPV